MKEKMNQLKHKLTAIYLAYKRKDTPILAKFVAFLTVAYALSPIDLIPDFIPIFGYLDDLLILPLMIALAIKLIPRKIMEESEKAARGLWEDGKPKKWYFAVPIVLFWVAILGLVFYLICML
jgi:uncharacterized membrane protein YkvA (DUF1232 family)